MRTVFLGSFVLLIITLSGCSGTLDPAEGYYSYQAYDQSGRLVVTGLLRFDKLDIDGVKGSWQMNNVNGSERTGISEAFGVFEGFLKGDALYLNLNPGWVDNNVILQGMQTSGGFEGDWAYIGFPGVLNQGKFKAFHE
jgi:hypothetical protein